MLFKWYCQIAESVLLSSPMKTLTIKLPDPLFAEISSDAKTRKISMSEIVRERLTRPDRSRNSLWSRMPLRQPRPSQLEEVHYSVEQPTNRLPQNRPLQVLLASAIGTSPNADNVSFILTIP